MKYWSKICLVALVSIGSSAAAQDPKTKSPIAAEKPLTYANVVSSFKSAGLRPTERQKRCHIFFEGEWTNRDVYDYGLIIIENSDEDIQVTFYVTDAHEMNWMTEFLDAPYFSSSETQELFQMMNSDHDVRNARIGRFRRVD